jgi:hypothetical protein
MWFHRYRHYRWHWLAVRVWITNGIDEVDRCLYFRRYGLAIQVWIANSFDEVSSVPAFLKLISRSRAIGWLMMLIKITNLGMVAPCSMEKITWLTIPGRDKLMIPREEYLGIKWELIYKEMVFANHWVVLRFLRWNYSRQMR